MKSLLTKTSPVGFSLLVAGLLSAQAAAPTSPQGVITERVYFTGGGTAVTDLTGSTKFPDSPDIVSYEPYFEMWAGGDINTAGPGGVADNYGTQIVGYFYPPTTGNYVFYICSDDNSSLYLSTDDNPANKKLIAQETAWSNPRQYGTSAGNSDLTAKDSSQFTGSQWPTKNTITLTAGKAYYIEALYKEGGGGDNLSVSMDASLPIPGAYLSSFDKNTGAVSVKTPPANQTVAEGAPVTFTVVPDGSPNTNVSYTVNYGETLGTVFPGYTYQWNLNGTAIANATNQSYTLARAPLSDNNGQFTVTVTGGQGSPVTSAAAKLTVTADTTAPTLTAVSASSDFTHVTLTFSKPMLQSTAQNTANYSIQGLTINAAALSAANDSQVVLTTGTQAPGTTYTVVINGLKDQTAAGNTIAASTTKTFMAWVFFRGAVMQKYWSGFSGGTSLTGLETLTNQANYPNNPRYTTIEPEWQYPPNSGPYVAPASGGNEAGDNYANELSGWIVPPQTGDYVFFLCSDDQSELYLSTDDNPANIKLIAQVTGWSDPRRWTNPNSADATAMRSDQFTGSLWPTPNVISLTAGRKYYMKAIHVEGGGGDNVDVAWRLPNDAADPTSGSAPINGSYTGFYIDPSYSSVQITTQPVATTAVDGKSVSFTVAAKGTNEYGSSVLYQWQRNGVNIAGATSPTYSINKVTLSADNGAQYDVIVSTPGLSVTSSVVALTVVADTFPPIVQSAGALKNPAGTFDVGVNFDEALDLVSATTAANYTLSSGTVTKATLWTNAPNYGLSANQYQGVVLTTSGLTPGNKYTVTVKNVADVKGNKIGSTNMDFTVSAMSWGAVGADQMGLGGAAVAVGTNGFNLFSDGIAEWNNYDEATFVYEQITGDFDKKLRIEYQDLSSQWARAGLVMREATNFGVDAAAQTGDPTGASSNSPTAPYAGKAGRYQKVHVNPQGPTMTGPGTAANNQWETNRRLDIGGPSSNAGNNRNTSPIYPHAWARMQRIGQMFNVFRSDDGQNWTWMGTTLWPDANDQSATAPGANMPNTVYVGPEFSPENGNITQTTDRGMWLAAIRDYGDTWPAVVPTVAKRDYSIGLHFGADEPSGANLSTLAPTDVAGVPGIKQKNWNNFTGASGTTSSGLVADVNGTAQNTSLSVAWSCPNTWASIGSRGETNNMLSGADGTLMMGYLDTGYPSTTTVTINNITTNLTSGGYDVYVYIMGGVGSKGGAYRIVEPVSGNTIKDYVFAQVATYPTNYYPVPSGTSPTNYGTGDYIVFTGLNAPNIRVESTTDHGYGLTISRGSGDPRAPIAAIQLVAPTTGVPVSTIKLTVAKSGSNLTISWTPAGGTLQTTPSLSGTPTWTAVGTANPATIPIGTGNAFYRVKSP